MVLVTGAAGAIGGATIRALSSAGYGVVGFDRAAADAPEADVEHVQVDVSDRNALRDAMESVRSVGCLAHVIGVAGGAQPGEPDTQDDPATVDVDVVRSSLENNLVSQFQVVQAALPLLRDGTERDRSFTFTSSFNALSAQGMPGYSAAKAGLIGLMHALVGPLGRDGIRVNVLAPGTIRTPRTERLYRSTPGHFERLESGTALGRLGTPEDVAEGYLALVRMRHLTGQTLVLDGGQTSIHR